MAKEPMEKRFKWTIVIKSKDNDLISTKDNDMLTNNFETGFNDKLDIICNVVTILPIEFERATEVTEEDDVCLSKEITDHQPMCYYIISNGGVKEENDIFMKPDEDMKKHLKSLFIQVKVNGVGVNKVLVDGGATFNLIPKFLLKRIGKKRHRFEAT